MYCHVNCFKGYNTVVRYNLRFSYSDLEGRKEVLESDLESAIKSFELTQQELTELREAKERVEDVLEKTTTFLVNNYKIAIFC